MFGKISSDLKRNGQTYVLLAPYLLLFTLFTVVPVVMSIALSFSYFNLLEFPRWVGWDNFMKLFVEDEVFIIALKNTFLFSVITGPISYVACFVFAWMINEMPRKVRALLTLLFYAPSISGNIYFMWQLIFNGDAYGYINGFLMKARVIFEPIQWLTNEKYIMAVIIIVQLWLSLGISFLAFIAGLQNVDKSLFEAGAVDGITNRWQELWYITLPSIRPMLMFGAVMQITGSFAMADVATNLAGFPSVNYAAHTIVTHLVDYGSIRFEMGYSSAIATVLFIMMITINLIVQKLLKKIGE